MRARTYPWNHNPRKQITVKTSPHTYSNVALHLPWRVLLLPTRSKGDYFQSQKPSLWSAMDGVSYNLRH